MEAATTDTRYLKPSSSDPLPGIPKKKGILKEKLAYFDLLKRAGIIKTDDADTEIKPAKSSILSKNIYIKIAARVMYWFPFLTSLLELTGKVGDIIAQEESYNCGGYPPWSISLSVANAVASLGVAILCTKLQKDLDKQSEREKLLHEKELQEAYFAQFTKAFDVYKDEIKNILHHHKHHKHKVKGDSSSNEEEEEPMLDREEQNETQASLEKSLRRCIKKLNKCPEEKQNHHFTREMWISQMIYLMKRGLKQIEKMENEFEEDQNGEEPELRIDGEKQPVHVVSLFQKASQNASKLAKSEPSKKKLTRADLKRKKHFSAEMASLAVENKKWKKEENYREKFDRAWERLQDFCGPLNYLASNSKIIGANGRIYMSEEEAIEAVKEEEEAASSKEMVVIDISHSRGKEETDEETGQSNGDDEYGV